MIIGNDSCQWETIASQEHSINGLVTSIAAIWSKNKVMN